MIALQNGGYLLIEVDGEQHFVKDYKGKSAKEQFNEDREKDKRAYAAGYKLLRLHHDNIKKWAECIKGALELSARNPGTPFVLYSPAYKKLYRLKDMKPWE